MQVSLASFSSENIENFKNIHCEVCSFKDNLKSHGLFSSQYHLYLRSKEVNVPKQMEAGCELDGQIGTGCELDGKMGKEYELGEQTATGYDFSEQMSAGYEFSEQIGSGYELSELHGQVESGCELDVNIGHQASEEKSNLLVNNSKPGHIVITFMWKQQSLFSENETT